MAAKIAAGDSAARLAGKTILLQRGSRAFDADLLDA